MHSHVGVTAQEEGNGAHVYESAGLAPSGRRMPGGSISQDLAARAGRGADREGPPVRRVDLARATEAELLPRSRPKSRTTRTRRSTVGGLAGLFGHGAGLA